MANSPFFIGVDVGTASVRAAVVSETGHIVSSSTQTIRIFNPQPDFFQQSSRDIWTQTCVAVRTAVALSNIDKRLIRAISFDATCSLVCVDMDGVGVPIGPDGQRETDPDWQEQDVVMWMDHRAVQEATQITALTATSTYLLPPFSPSSPTEVHIPFSPLRHLGSSISPEHEISKLLHLRKNSSTWPRIAAGSVWDLCDYLSHRACGSTARSDTSTVCKWCLAPPEVPTAQGVARPGDRWPRDFFAAIGLPEIAPADPAAHHPAGTVFVPPGTPLRPLSPDAASAMGLDPTRTVVAAGMVDAHAGWVGCVAVGSGGGGRGLANVEAGADSAAALHGRLVAILGTSACFLASRAGAVDVPGVWGPYGGVLGLEGAWCAEGGQSLTGAAIDHVLTTSAAYDSLKGAAEEAGVSVHEFLNRHLRTMTEREAVEDERFLTRHLHTLPTFLGLRSPDPDPHLLGAVSGLGLHPANSIDHLALEYLSCLQGLAYGFADVLDAIEKGDGKEGYAIRELVACGGIAANDLFCRTVADVTGRPLIVPPSSTSSPLIGSAICAAHAHRVSSSPPESPPPTFLSTMLLMGSAPAERVVAPSGDERVRKYHDAKRRVVTEMKAVQRKWRVLMSEV
ncbi:Pentulose kinase [Gonapodya prolifera JEL478]|uniref:Pentulose kinase n=1 Tax=Gonapodya prolifera (strain JEL478) TaxID=1344416 RepID=A0A139B0R0_GONPJ|nr:Pentulose kinase [Gonapodya prolifera JEL478]|eukprot:KXS22581.1 Pentulose kinase [Gonapodya prolifera JEL478]